MPDGPSLSLLGAVEVLDAEAAPVPLASFWAQRDCVLVFLRHFACPTCSELVGALLPRLPELSALDVGVVLVGAGSPAACDAFSTRMRLDGGELTLVTSPDLAAHHAAGLLRSRAATYGLRSLWTSLALYALGHFARRRPDDGDITQQGGMLYVRRGGELAFQHRNRALGDEASPSEVVELALRMALEGADALV